MTTRSRAVTAALLIIVPVLFNVFFFLLQSTFGYPDILREPADSILRQFAAGGTSLLAIWYGFALTPALFIPAAVLLRRAFPGDSPLLALATPFAIVAGVAQVLGLLRWPFLVPGLAQAYLDPAASDATREAVLVVFSAFHQYAGVAVGEHLGYLATGAWTLVIAGAMLAGAPFRSWLGWVGIVAALGILAGLLEPAGFALGGTINAFAYILWSLWLIATAVCLLRVPVATAALPQAAQPATAGRGVSQ
ncbi:MAG: DUF4386 domain-containing protein [Chloroflexota bacterium]|nr:DUF4386 domain-containing protein [Chloroflexota bacterium]